VIHRVRKSALPSGSLDFAVPTVLLHLCMEVLVVLPARIAAKFDADKQMCHLFSPTQERLFRSELLSHFQQAPDN